MIPTPIRQVLLTIQSNGVQALHMGGQACVFYGAAQVSKVDFVLLADEPEGSHRDSGDFHPGHEHPHPAPALAALNRSSRTMRKPSIVLVLVLFLAGHSPAADPEPTLGRKGPLLLEEKFDGDMLPKGWTGKTGGLRVADGALHAGQKKDDGRLGLFSRELPMQDAAIQIDFKFAGARGINISCNPSPGELSKHGHLFSLLIRLFDTVRKTSLRKAGKREFTGQIAPFFAFFPAFLPS